MSSRGILYWITGLSGAGKTTIGNRLYYELRKKNNNVVLLDGDILKNIVDECGQGGYSEEERRKRAMKYALLCRTLTEQGMIVICCTIAMYDEVRAWNRKNNKGYVEIFLDVSQETLRDRDQKGMYSKYRKGVFKNLAGADVRVEFPKNPDLILKNEGQLTIKECVEKILGLNVNFSSDFDRDVAYWNHFYGSNLDIEYPSLFAQSVVKTLVRNRNLLELGCGNGRDSCYFARNGINVTAIDASEKAIEKLQKSNCPGNICFICDDFVCSPAIFAGQFDYCYSRFSLHAINSEQEDELIKNVYRVLKFHGQFFIEARCIHDEIYGLGDKIAENTYIYQGHFRRFIIKEELEKKLILSGFDVIYSEEKTGFAPFGQSNPPVIRVIAEKMSE